jgi:rare lipoprotein A
MPLPRSSTPRRIAWPTAPGAVGFVLLILLAGCASQQAPLPTPPPEVAVPAAPPAVLEPRVLETRTGLASYYHPSLDGLETASGIPYDDDALMAAHPTYPLGTVARVTNLENGTSVEVDITDRGPTAENVAEGVIIDLSGAAAKALGMIEAGRVRVKVEVIYWGANERSS